MGEAICDYYYHVAISQSSHASYYRASQRPVAASMVARTDSFDNPSRSIFQTLILCKIRVQTVQLAIRRGQNERERAAEVAFRHQLLPRLYLCLCRGMLEIPSLSHSLLQLRQDLVLRCVGRPDVEVLICGLCRSL
jgi:hypothetical protein